MKRPLIQTMLLAVGVAAGLMLVTSCAHTNVKQLSGRDFLEQTQRIGQPDSMEWTSYLGISCGRVYLEYGHMEILSVGNEFYRTIYWTPTSELPSGLVTQLKSGNPPWTNLWTGPARKP
jgi:hypothetical protein